MPARRPPRQVCPRCGTNHYAWRDSTPCASCARELAAEADTADHPNVLRREARRDAGNGQPAPGTLDYWGNPL